MEGLRTSLRFLLNGELVELDQLKATTTLLDYLRLQRGLKGSKEGCAEGDCGACTVLIGRMREGALAYETATSCITFVGMLDGAHVVTVEHLSAGDALNPVQQAMVEQHGSQCGFCTPGIVMSLEGLFLGTPAPGQLDVERALQGNLCRCTGYRPIVAAALSLDGETDFEADPVFAGRDAVAARLPGLHDGRRVEIGAGRERIIVPASVDDLAEAYAANPTATLVAGATDVGLWVTKFMRDIGPLIFVGNVPGFDAIEVRAGEIVLGAGVTYTRARNAMLSHFPQLGELWDRIGGQQVRNMGTIGANIANGSPIGDTPPALIALGARITLRKGNARRVVKLKDFFIAYGKQDRAPGEFVESISIPLLGPDDHFAAYKVSKRRDEDISSLCGAFKLFVNDRGEVGSIRIAFGGMAATPKRARAVEAALTGRPWTSESVEAALAAFAADFQPLTDMRASAEYRLTVAKNLLRRFLLETTGRGERLRREVA